MLGWSSLRLYPMETECRACLMRSPPWIQIMLKLLYMVRILLVVIETEGYHDRERRLKREDPPEGAALFISVVETLSANQSWVLPVESDAGRTGSCVALRSRRSNRRSRGGSLVASSAACSAARLGRDTGSAAVVPPSERERRLKRELPTERSGAGCTGGRSSETIDFSSTGGTTSTGWGWTGAGELWTAANSSSTESLLSSGKMSAGAGLGAGAGGGVGSGSSSRAGDTSMGMSTGTSAGVSRTSWTG